MSNDTTWWDEAKHLAAEGFEVGWQHGGHPTPQQKRENLQRMLDIFGNQSDAWLLPPTIRYQHIETTTAVEITSDGYLLAVPLDCGWAVHGILKEKPEFGHIPEGVRIPSWENFREQIPKKSPPLEAYAQGVAHQ